MKNEKFDRLLSEIRNELLDEQEPEIKRRMSIWAREPAKV